MENGGNSSTMGKVIWEQKATLVATGCETIEVNGFSSHPEMVESIPSVWWMEFQLADGQTIKVEKHRREDLPDVDLGAIHWMRLEQSEDT